MSDRPGCGRRVGPGKDGKTPRSWRGGALVLSQSERERTIRDDKSPADSSRLEGTDILRGVEVLHDPTEQDVISS